MGFYTNVQVFGNKILLSEYNNGKKSRRKLDFFPSVFVPTKEKTEFHDILGNNLKEVKPGTIKETREFINKYKDVKGFEIYGNLRHEYSYITETYRDQHINWNYDLITIMQLDIEVASGTGYASAENPYQPIQTITMKIKQGSDTITYVLGYKEDYKPKRPDIKYFKCSDEIELLRTFISLWSKKYPDVITGWYVKHFDIPYCIKRIEMILGEEEAKKLSPWNYYSQKFSIFMNKEQVYYSLWGIAILDYMELYKKFATGGASQENYQLNNIANVELGLQKLDFGKYDNLHDLYENDFETFVDYNIWDVELIDKLDTKLKLIELAITLAYDAKVNYEDVFMQVRMWDILIYNKLWTKNIIIPPKETQIREDYLGAFVKDPQVGMHKWIVSYDLTSLYPHLIMQFNISPDMIIEPKNYNEEMRKLLSQDISIDSLLHETPVITETLKTNNITLTPNAQFFDISKKGFLSEIMEEMFADRSKYKKKMLEAKKALEKETDEEKKKELKNTISRFDNLQQTKKICLNSAYGALGNPHCRFYDTRQAEAITSSGQLAIRWVAKDINAYLNNLLETEYIDYVIASDTDSIYLTLEKLVNKFIKKDDPNIVIPLLDKICEEKLQPFIDKSYARLAKYLNAYAQKMQMKREALCDKGVWTAKKRYLLNVYNSEGVAYAKPKIKISGLEAIKSSTPTICRKKIKEAYDIVMNGNEQQMLDFIETFRNEFKQSSPEDIAFPRSVNGLDEYFDKNSLYKKGTPIHVKGSLIYNNELKNRKLDKKYQAIMNGEKIKFIYLKEPNLFKSPVISFSVIPKEFELEKYIDYNTQFEKSFLEPIKTILNVIHWKTEHNDSLEEYF